MNLTKKLLVLVLCSFLSSVAMDQIKELPQSPPSVFGLLAAVELSRLDKVAEFLERGVDVNGLDEEGRSAFYSATLRKDKAIALLLLRYGADPDLVPYGESIVKPHIIWTRLGETAISEEIFNQVVLKGLSQYDKRMGERIICLLCCFSLERTGCKLPREIMCMIFGMADDVASDLVKSIFNSSEKAVNVKIRQILSLLGYRVGARSIFECAFPTSKSQYTCLVCLDATIDPERLILKADMGGVGSLDGEQNFKEAVILMWQRSLEKWLAGKTSE